MKTKRYLPFAFLLAALSMLCLLLSCIPVFDRGKTAVLKNCTEDTLFIGASHYDNIDSVDCQLFPFYNMLANSGLDTTGVSIWKNIEEPYERSFGKDGFIYPDSTCATDYYLLFTEDNDTCYFFLVKWHDAKQYSWDEIRSKKLYRRWMTVKNKDGEFDRNIRYD